MGRAVKDSRLDTREARLKLKQRADREPYWRLIQGGLHLGYRKGTRGGVWMVRIYQDGKYQKRALGYADDIRDSNGHDILNYKQALAAAQAEADKVSLPAPPAPLSVRDVLEDYLDWYAANRKAVKTTRQAVDAHIRPRLEGVLVADLTTQKIRQWHQSIAKASARARTSKRGKQSNIRLTYDPRARKATANRVLTILKASLNHAWREGKIPSDDAWRKVKPFSNVETPKIRCLSVEECTRLINGAATEFRPLIQAALYTGCRYGELTRLVCGDFNPDSGTLLIREAKAGRPRHVYLTSEAQNFFARQVVKKDAAALIFHRTDGSPWGQAHQQRPLAMACKAARIKPAISFHVLRHTYGSALAMKGVPLQVIAEALGHADTRITHRHYAHLMPSYIASTIRANAPTFGLPKGNVHQLKRRKRSTP